MPGWPCVIYMMDLFKTFLSRGFSALAAFLLSIFIARMLTPEDAGIYFSGLTLMAGMAIIIRCGFDNYLIKMNAESSTDMLSNFISLSFFSLVIFVVFAPVFILAFHFLNESVAMGLSRVINYFIVAALFFTFLWIASGFLKSVGCAPLANFTEAGLLPVCLIVCYLLLLGYMSLELAVQLYFVILVLCVAVLYAYILLNYRGSIRIRRITSLQLQESSGIMFSGLFDFFVLWFSGLVLIKYVAMSDVADFQIAQRLSILISFILLVANSITAPIFARQFAQGEIAKAGKIYGVSNCLMTLLALLPLGLFWFAPEYLLGFFGEEYRDAGWILIILSFGQLINVMSGSVGYVLMMSGHSRLYRNSSFCAALLSIGLALWLVPVFGAIGAAVASSAGLAGKNLVGVYFARRLFGFQAFPTISGLVNILTLREDYEIFTHRH